MISVWTHVYLFYNLGYNESFCYLVAELIPALPIGNSFRLAPVSLVLAPLSFSSTSFYSDTRCLRVIWYLQCSIPRISHSLIPFLWVCYLETKIEH